MTTINLLLGARSESCAILTDEHAACSYKQPVLVYEGQAYGPADRIDMGVFGMEPAYEHGRCANVPAGGLDADQVALMAKWIARQPA